MLTPFPYKKESRLFGDALAKVAQDVHKQKISQYVSRENMQSFRHGKGWLTVRSDGTEESHLNEAGVDLSIDYSSIVNNDIQKLFDFVSNFIEGFTSQIVKMMFETINEACDQSGNVVKSSDYPSKAEAFLEMLKTIEFSVNEYGQVELPQMHVAPNEGKALLDELNSQAEDFRKEVERVKSEKSLAAIEREKERLSKYKGISL